MLTKLRHVSFIHLKPLLDQSCQTIETVLIIFSLLFFSLYSILEKVRYIAQCWPTNVPLVILMFVQCHPNPICTNRGLFDIVLPSAAVLGANAFYRKVEHTAPN